MDFQKNDRLESKNTLIEINKDLNSLIEYSKFTSNISLEIKEHIKIIYNYISKLSGILMKIIYLLSLFEKRISELERK